MAWTTTVRECGSSSGFHWVSLDPYPFPSLQVQTCLQALRSLELGMVARLISDIGAKKVLGRNWAADNGDLGLNVDPKWLLQDWFRLRLTKVSVIASIKH